VQALDRRGEGRERWSPSQLATLAGLAGVALVFIGRSSFAYRGHRYWSLFDDGMISLTYARNLADGHGLVWVAGGQHVEGYSAFLWTLLLALVQLLPVPERLVPLVVELVGAGLLLLNLVLVRAIALRLTHRTWTATAAMVLVAAYYPLTFWALRGMEVSLVAVLTSAAILMALHLAETGSTRDLRGLLIVVGLLLLTRDDCAVAAMVVVAWSVASAPRGSRGKRAAVLGLGTATVLAIHAAARVAYYGSALPNTYYLKVYGIPWGDRLLRGTAGIVNILSLELYLPVALAVGLLVWRRGRLMPAGWLLGLLVVGQLAYSLLVGGDAWESVELANRYVTVAAPALLILAVVAIEEIVATTRSQRQRVLAPIVLIVAAVVALRAADVRLESRLQFGRIPTEWWPTRLGVPLVALLLLLVLVWAVIGSSDRARTRAAGAAVIVVVLAGGVREWSYWAQHNAFQADSRTTSVLGLGLREATSPTAVIALAAAGGSAYFAHRPTLDLGGKSDRVIAHERPRSPIFIPGHDKYDYEYSVRDLRPDVVVPLGVTTSADRALFVSWGYDLVGRLYVRRDSQSVDREALARL